MEENIDEIRLKDVILKVVYFKNVLKRNKLVILAVAFLFGVLSSEVKKKWWLPLALFFLGK